MEMTKSQFICLILSLALITGIVLYTEKPTEVESNPTTTIEESITIESTTAEETTTDICESTTLESTTVEQTTVKEKTVAPMDDIELLALVAVAEAEGESEYGKRLVIDTILNRVDHPRFPNTIHGVVYQKNQFTSMWNGRTKRCVVTDEVRQLVREELESRTNSDVIFFQMGGYSKYGEPLFKEGCHYFSSY